MNALALRHRLVVSLLLVLKGRKCALHNYHAVCTTVPIIYHAVFVCHCTDIIYHAVFVCHCTDTIYHAVCVCHCTNIIPPLMMLLTATKHAGRWSDFVRFFFYRYMCILLEQIVDK